MLMAVEHAPAATGAASTGVAADWRARRFVSLHVGVRGLCALPVAANSFVGRPVPCCVVWWSGRPPYSACDHLKGAFAEVKVRRAKRASRS